MQTPVNANVLPMKSCLKRKTNGNDLNFVDDVELNSIDYGSEDEEFTDDELQELQSKDVLVKQSLRKIAKIRELPDYGRIEKILNANSSSKSKRSLNSIVTMKSPAPFWNTYSHLLKEIEDCIANKYWNKLTKLLIYLSGTVRKCEPILLKATIIHFISDPASQLEEFLKECCSCRTEQDIDCLLTKLFHIK